MNDQYKNSYKATAKELVSLSVYNVGYQLCDAGYQWGPGIRDHYLIHYVISGKGTYEVNNETHFLSAEDAFLVYPNTEIIYRADAKTPWEYAWVGFTGSDAATILQATDFSRKHPCIHAVPNGEEVKRQLLHIYDARGNGFEHAVEMTGRLYTTLALFLKSSTQKRNAVGFYFVMVMGMFDFSIGANIMLSAIVGCVFATRFNLGYFGLIVGCILTGTIVARLHQHIRPHIIQDRVLLLF